MRCLSCKYDLSQLTEHRCPECGRAFDPTDPGTFHSESLSWVRYVVPRRNRDYAASLVVLGLLIVFWLIDPPRHMRTAIINVIIGVGFAIWLGVLYIWIARVVYLKQAKRKW